MLLVECSQEELGWTESKGTSAHGELALVVVVVVVDCLPYSKTAADKTTSSETFAAGKLTK